MVMLGGFFFFFFSFSIGHITICLPFCTLKGMDKPIIYLFIILFLLLNVVVVIITVFFCLLILWI